MRLGAAASLALSLVLGLCPLTTAGVKVGGDVRLEMTWAAADENYRGADDLVALEVFNNAATRLKIRYTADTRKWGAYLEQGVYSDSQKNDVLTREAYFWCRIGQGRFLVGQTFSICADYGPNQVLDGWNGLDSFGHTDFDRYEQIRLETGKKYRFKFALAKPDKGDVWNYAGLTWHPLPRLEAAAEFHFGFVVVHPYANLEMVRWKNGDRSDGYQAWDFGLQINGQFGIIGFMVGVGYGVNTKAESFMPSTSPLVVNNKIEGDVHEHRANAELRLGGLSLGYGCCLAQREDWAEDPWTQGAYINYDIPLGPAELWPAVAYQDLGQDEKGRDEGHRFLFGLFSRMRF